MIVDFEFPSGVPVFGGVGGADGFALEELPEVPAHAGCVKITPRRSASVPPVSSAAAPRETCLKRFFELVALLCMTGLIPARDSIRYAFDSRLTSRCCNEIEPLSLV